MMTGTVKIVVQKIRVEATPSPKCAPDVKTYEATAVG